MFAEYNHPVPLGAGREVEQGQDRPGKPQYRLWEGTTVFAAGEYSCQQSCEGSAAITYFSSVCCLLLPPEMACTFSVHADIDIKVN